MHRQRPHPEHLAPGDTFDCWRVAAIEPGRRLELAAEMKMPGKGWLRFEVLEREVGAAIRQTALFEPAGLLGLIYWYCLYPIHLIIWSGMLREIARRAGTPPSTE